MPADPVSASLDEAWAEADMERMGSIMRLVAAEAVHATSQGRWYPKPVAERILAVIYEVREQAATEARRELLAKVEGLALDDRYSAHAHLGFDKAKTAVRRLIEEV